MTPQAWDLRSHIKAWMIDLGHTDLSGKALNAMAGIPTAEPMPREMFGLLGNAHDLA